MAVVTDDSRVFEALVSTIPPTNLTAQLCSALRNGVLDIKDRPSRLSTNPTGIDRSQ
jgi:hypothetical protein